MKLHCEICQFTLMLPCLTTSHNLTYLFKQILSWFTCTMYNLCKPDTIEFVAFFFKSLYLIEIMALAGDIFMLKLPVDSNTWVVKRSQVV